MEEHKPEGKHYLTSSLRVCAGLYQIAALLAENMPMIDSPLDREQRMQSMTAVQPVLRFVRESYGQAITIQRAAAMAGYEKTRFCQLFKQAVGFSFHRYLTSYRMESARSLLQETSLPITSIADLVGISQPKTFSRLFRAAYHTTPTEYRNCIKEGNTTR